MYEVSWDELKVVHDSHPQYTSTAFAAEVAAPNTIAVQHQLAHVASDLAELGEYE